MKRSQKLKLRDRYISLRLWAFIAVMLGTLVFHTLEAQPPNPIHKEATWKCQACNIRCWVDKPDWRGDYYCPRCGTKK